VFIFNTKIQEQIQVLKAMHQEVMAEREQEKREKHQLLFQSRRRLMVIEDDYFGLSNE